jgi:hypothetical protein
VPTARRSLDVLLDISSLNAGIVVPHETTFSLATLATLVERPIVEFAPQASQKEIGLRMVPSSAVVRTDPTLAGLCRISFPMRCVTLAMAGS